MILLVADAIEVMIHEIESLHCKVFDYSVETRR